ncbi:hypothetical protein BGZ54_004646 [Gamsiella multidivaricata]|nr:hypothetical protein BGZ54_004646 [Gamsiella multidivaricata]
MAKTHMVSNAYKGHVKKLKAELIYKAKVKSDHAKVLKQADDNTPEFHKKGSVDIMVDEGEDDNDDPSASTSPPDNPENGVAEAVQSDFYSAETSDTETQYNRVDQP